mmetsp:Transcript_85856/g.247935  ORF Transcript_85856/g.247935 Transcript_85856/m.247935 type:complete len:85 (+) Transcript_85856:91-345(+)|eukprot:CAMPEP_0170311652 /NCGR_PEP_ID=MMETSP0116_2-20130129/56342_1 /TAXON_ID=400756 /ORGANISM="Durinskia baltica, Strain CSIRO CS-38" /LENGTH=84 /DNA_ID=CAMNT_0010563987 /DNA_START=73 /DNA_END=327 /DNA_ORIENTATION=+
MRLNRNNHSCDFFAQLMKKSTKLPRCDRCKAAKRARETEIDASGIDLARPLRLSQSLIRPTSEQEQFGMAWKFPQRGVRHGECV